MRVFSGSGMVLDFFTTKVRNRELKFHQQRAVHGMPFRATFHLPSASSIAVEKMKSSSVKLCCLCLGLFGFASLTPVISAPRPNILYFYVDDMGWGSIRPNGQAERKAKGLPYVRTPNLDQLAAEGVNFTRAYGCTVCSPARSSQQTGFHQGHTFADRNDPDNAKKAMRADDVLMGDALSEAGYVTGYWGKWGIRRLQRSGEPGDPECADPADFARIPTCSGGIASCAGAYVFPADFVECACQKSGSGWWTGTGS